MIYLCPLKSTDSKSVLLSSNQLNSRIEKDKKLYQYLDKQLLINNAEFSIMVQDNSTGFLKGPSDWDISIIGFIKKKRTAKVG